MHRIRVTAKIRGEPSHAQLLPNSPAEPLKSAWMRASSTKTSRAATRRTKARWVQSQLVVWFFSSPYPIHLLPHASPIPSPAPPCVAAVVDTVLDNETTYEPSDTDSDPLGLFNDDWDIYQLFESSASLPQHTLDVGSALSSPTVAAVGYRDAVARSLAQFLLMNSIPPFWPSGNRSGGD